MQRIENRAIGLAQGTAILFSDFETGGAMWTGTGPRAVTHPVTFKEAFSGKPIVTVGIGMWDMDSGANIRADISAANITPLGFDIVFKTWGDTRIARIRADWTAIGETGHPDDWQLY